jgi:hypothetical protein
MTAAGRAAADPSTEQGPAELPSTNAPASNAPRPPGRRLRIANIDQTFAHGPLLGKGRPKIAWSDGPRASEPAVRAAQRRRERGGPSPWA